MTLLRASALRIPPHAGATQTPLAGPIDLELGQGEAIQVSGSSGSGKSTLLRCLAHLEARAEGAIEFRGSRVRGSTVPSFRRQVVYVPQTPPRFPMTVAASLAMAFHFQSAADSSFATQRAEAMCKQLLLPEDLLDRPLPRVSGGEAQRLGLVRALLLDPVVLLLDEPTSALDADAEDAVHALVGTWFAEGGRSVISITHKREILAHATRRRFEMADGRLQELS